MKNILLAIVLFSVPMAAFSQNKAINKFYRKHKRGKEVRNAKLPGFLLRTIGKMAIKRSEMSPEDERLAKQLMKKAGGVKFMYSEDVKKIPQSDLLQLKEGMYNDNFDDLIMLHGEGTDFQLMINEVEGTVKNLFLIYNDSKEGEMALISMKMNITLDEITNLVEKGMEEHYHEIMEIEEEPVDEPVM